MIKDSDTVGKSGACGLASRRLAFGGSEGGRANRFDAGHCDFKSRRVLDMSY
jgi:hypothetical protein